MRRQRAKPDRERDILRRLFFVTQLNSPYQGCLCATPLWWASNPFVHPQFVAVASPIFRESFGGTNAFHVQAAFNSISLSSKACTGIQVHINSLVFSGSGNKNIKEQVHPNIVISLIFCVNSLQLKCLCKAPPKLILTPNSRPSRMA